MRVFLLTILTLLLNFSVQAQETKKSAKWFDKIKIGGYMQVRYTGCLNPTPI